MVKSFSEFYEEVTKNEPLTKVENLEVEEITIQLIDNDDLGSYIEMFLNKDPNIAGKVRYESYEKAKMAWDNLNSLGDILNYMNYNMKNTDTAHKWAHIIGVEVAAIKKLSPEEIKDIGLNFQIKSDLEREAEIQAKLAASEMEAAAEFEAEGGEE